MRPFSECEEVYVCFKEITKLILRQTEFFKMNCDMNSGKIERIR